jgi:CO/xanthine dehydrogenase FAD-binding subunit
MKLPNFEYLAPSSPAEVVALLAAHRGEAKIIAGGQSLLPTMAFRLAQPAYLVDLRNVEGMNRIVIDDTGVRLGARKRSRTSRTTRSAIAAPSAAASRTPILPLKCRASRPPAKPSSRCSALKANGA